MNYLYFLAMFFYLFVCLFVSVAAMIVAGGGRLWPEYLFLVDKLEGKIKKEIWKICF